MNHRTYVGLTLLTYWLLVMGMWGIDACDRGLPLATGFPVSCQTGLWNCLIYGDELRPFNAFQETLSLILPSACLPGKFSNRCSD